jgi:hypothetical protein
MDILDIPEMNGFWLAGPGAELFLVTKTRKNEKK